ncbi:hypothetical protein BRADI_4g08706v3 [Brachypodium distachyon]|uniref:RNase H type-1 domain-containing protein n=1 Tax=Brachypodium distachyon TaxID=15368 RepID=A0A0Q3L348_BRADI|nr:hypothetical protein BRADI_4g08706v3 [Brachypodium distachyon]
MARGVGNLVDEQLVEHQNTGASAAVCHDETGTYVGSPARIFDHLTDLPTTQEAMACCEALALVKDLNLKRICIASNAQVVIKITSVPRRLWCADEISRGVVLLGSPS